MQRVIWRAFFLFLLALISIAAVFLFGEVALRLKRVVFPARVLIDPQLGWKINAHVKRVFPSMTLDEQGPFSVEYQSEENGFRVWGNPQSPKKKLLVIGDSYTDAIMVSADKTYYACLAETLGSDWELFAYGAGGYGSLQEYIIMSNHWEEIQPDLVVWQWCFNDLCNNSFYMDSRTVENFSINPRPFLERDTIVVRYPRKIPVLSRYSYLYRFLVPKLKGLLLTLDDQGVDERDLSKPWYQDALKTTDNIAAKVKALTGDTPVFVFIAGGAGHNEPLFQLSERHGFHTVRTVNETLNKRKSEGVVVECHPSVGGHWSEQGHKFVGQEIYQAIQKDLFHPPAGLKE